MNNGNYVQKYFKRNLVKWITVTLTPNDISYVASYNLLTSSHLFI